MWTRPGLSVVTVMVTQAGLYYLTSVSLVTSLAWVTWVWPAIRVAPAPGSETFTPGHPDLMSAPEMEAALANFSQNMTEFTTGLWLLRREQPGKFCLVLSSVFTMLAILGTKVTAGLLLHTALPGLVVRARRTAQLSPVIEALTECGASLGEML